MTAGQQGGFDEFSIEEERLKALEFSMKRVQASVTRCATMEEMLVRQRHYNTLQDLRNEIRNTMWAKNQILPSPATN